MKQYFPFKKIAICICFGLFFCASNAQTVKEYQAMASQHFSNKEYDAAIDNYTKAINLSPDPQLYYGRGYAYQSNKMIDLAIADYSTAISLNPQYKPAYVGRGNCYYGKKNIPLALQDYNQAILMDPNAVNYYNRGNLNFYRQKYDDALDDFDRAIELNASYQHAYYARAMVFGALKDYDLAMDDYDHLLSLNAQYLNAYIGKANIYTKKKDHESAIKELTKAITIAPNYLAAYNNRGLSYAGTGAYDLAVNDFKKAILLDEKKEASYAILNIIEPLARLYRFSEAATYYNTYRSSYTGGYIDNVYWLFFKKYMEAITQNLANNDYAASLVNLKEAERLYNTKVKSETGENSQSRNFSSILALKGYVLEKLNNKEEAKQAYEQALLLNAIQPDITVALQRLLKKEEVVAADDHTPPVINILEPLINNRSIAVEDDKVAGTTQRIRGRAIDAGGIRSVMLNNRALKVEENGYFDTTVNVSDGVNVFTIVVTDKNANTVSENVQVVTGKEKTNAAPVTATNSGPLNYNPVYHAILIAESEYADKNILSLEGPVKDMRKIYNLLVNNYSFIPANTDSLVNVSRANILEAIIKKANAMNENDNLFIFYAGHGQMITQPDKSEEGFLVPQDAVKGMLSSYISSDDLLRTIKYSKAKHILFVADACFAGSLFRDMATDAPLAVADAYKDKSRKLLASGNRTVVPDQSEFIEYLRLALQENREKYITAEQLIDSFKNQYKNTTHLQLQYYPIKNVDDLGGQFVFKRK